MKKWIKTILINALIMFVLLVIGDVLIGWYYGVSHNVKAEKFRYAALREHKLNRVWQQSPGDEALEVSTTLKDTLYTIRTDSDGFIVGPEEPEKEEVDVIFFGGSTTECSFVNENLRFPYLTGKLLSDQDGGPIKVLNGGRSGNNSWHSMIALVGKGLPYEPKVMVLMHNINDFTGLVKTGSYWEAPANRNIVGEYSEVELSRIGRLGRALQYLFFPNITRVVKTKLQAPETVNVDEWADYRSFQDIDIVERFPGVKEDFKSSLKSFVSLAKIWGITPVLMTQANRYKLGVEDSLLDNFYNKRPQEFDYDTFKVLYGEFNEIIRTVAREEDVILIDLDSQIPPEAKYIYDGIHLNDEGSTLAAEIISTSLVEQFPSIFSLKNN